MPQVGSEGQRKLLNSSVLIIGAGGLGSPAALYLALAGVGKIGIADFDVVDRSNLQRQVLHRDEDIGKRKVISAMETLKAYNPDINVAMHDEPINSKNALEGHHLLGLDMAGVPKNLAGTSFPFSYNKIEELKNIISTKSMISH